MLSTLLAASDAEAVSDGWLVLLGVFVGFVIGRVVFGRRATFRAGVAKGEANAAASAVSTVSVVATGGTVVDEHRSVSLDGLDDLDHSAGLQYVVNLDDVDHDGPAAIVDRTGSCHCCTPDAHVARRGGAVGELVRGSGGDPGASGGADDGRGVGGRRDHASAVQR